MNLPIAPIAAALLGTAAAVTLGVLPTGLLESLVVHSGVPSVVSAAEPPLGLTARALIAAGAGAGVAIFSWLTLFLLLGTRSIGLGRPSAPADEQVRTPVLRRADAHPDAPARAPLLATRDLGRPFLEVTAPRDEEDALPMSEPEPLDLGAMIQPEPVAPAVPLAPVIPIAPVAQPVPAPQPMASPPPHAYAPPVERPLPMDLDQPLAAFDPNAIPDEPAPLPEAVTPLHRGPRPAVFDESERFEVFELTPPVRMVSPTPAPVPRERTAPRDTEATVHALLERLEKGVASRAFETPAPPPSRLRDSERGLEEALVTLRNLARRA